MAEAPDASPPPATSAERWAEPRPMLVTIGLLAFAAWLLAAAAVVALLVGGETAVPLAALAALLLGLGLTAMEEGL